MKLSFDLSSDRFLFNASTDIEWKERDSFPQHFSPFVCQSCSRAAFFSLKIETLFPPTQRTECQMLFSDQLLMWRHLLPMKHHFKETISQLKLFQAAPSS